MSLSLREQHRALAEQRDFAFACDPRLFSDEQYALIRRWGYWYQGLTEAQLAPITDAQRSFIDAVKGRTPPVEQHAAAWWRYTHRLALEKEKGAAMHSTHQVDADTFYNRDMAKQLRKTMGGVNLREHKRT